LTPEEQINWDELLRRSQAGDQEAQNDLFRKLEVRLRPIVKYRLWEWPVEDHEDIVQDTLTVFFEKIDLIKSNPDFYVYKILQNKIGNAYQKHQQDMKITAQPDENGKYETKSNRQQRSQSNPRSSFLAQIESRDLINYVQEAIKRLPSFCQTFFLALFAGQKIQEIWEYFKELEPELQRGAFDKRLHNCRKKLTDLIKDQI
jgi:DNA-directed RNA polymerase specialized sigma24 family protein